MGNFFADFRSYWSSFSERRSGRDKILPRVVPVSETRFTEGDIVTLDGRRWVVKEDHYPHVSGTVAGAMGLQEASIRIVKVLAEGTYRLVPRETGFEWPPAPAPNAEAVAVG